MLRLAPLRLAYLVAVVAAITPACRCSSTALTGGACAPDVTPPEARDVKRYAIDSFLLPRERTAYADDLDGDGRADNQLGNLVALANAAGYQPWRAASAILEAGVITPEIELWGDGDQGAVKFRDSTAEVTVGGRFVDGKFVSNRTRCTRSPMQVKVRLPLLPDADPVPLVLDAVEIDVEARGDDLWGAMRGAVKPSDYERAAYDAITAMIRNRPREHLTVLRLLDGDHDGNVSFEELARSPLLSAIARPDVRLHDASGAFAPSGKRDAGAVPDELSIAFGLRGKRCANGDCGAIRPSHTPSCEDRFKNQHESDVDCGGECPPCAGGSRCSSGTDCLGGACESGRCSEPSCHDGRKNGAESDIDCGGPCAPCASGRGCIDGDDCAGMCSSGRCDKCRGDGDCRAMGRTTCTLGLCLPPSCMNGRRDGRESDVDCGGGDCPKCEDGKPCRDEADCEGGECEGFRCEERGGEREREEREGERDDDRR